MPEPKLCRTPSQISLATGRVFTQAHYLKARFDLGDFLRRWDAGRLPNEWLFELHYVRTRKC